MGPLRLDPPPLADFRSVKTALLAGTTQLASLAWTVALIVDPTPLEALPALITGVGIVGMSTVAVVGMVAVGGRWAHRLALATLGLTVVIALIRPVDFVWYVAIALTALSFVELLSPTVTRSIRKLPSASGPPPRAVAPALLLLAAPAVLGLLGNDAAPWALAIVALSAPCVALLYSRVFPGGLIAIRLFWPLIAIAFSPWLGWWAGSAAVLLAVTVAVMAWHGSVKASFHPPHETGTTYPIPPELAPPEVLDAAQIDERGNPR